MRRVAAHWLYLPDGEKMRLPVVEIEKNVVVNYYPIEDELPVTEWLGSVLVLSSKSKVSFSENALLGSLLENLQGGFEMVYPLYCWFVDGVDCNGGLLSSFSDVELLREED